MGGPHQCRLRWLAPGALVVQAGGVALPVVTIEQSESGFVQRAGHVVPGWLVIVHGWGLAEHPDDDERDAIECPTEGEAVAIALAVAAHRTGWEPPPWPGHLDDEADPLGGP